jgi:DNA polymerase I
MGHLALGAVIRHDSRVEPDAPTLFDVDAPPDGRTGAPGGVFTRAPAAFAVPSVRSSLPTLLAVDGDSLAHRAFHGYPAATTQGPVYGFLAMLASVCDQVAVDGLVVGFDCRERSERRERYPAYKGQRDDKDPGLLAVLLALPEGLSELGLHVVSPDGWEADDVVASAAGTAEATGWRCAVATSDRDAFCVVSDHTTVLRLRGRGQIMKVTPGSLAGDLRITPAQYVEYAAMRGDMSDNLPGVPGIGPVRAAALLRQYAAVADAVADPIGCRSVLGKDVGQALLDDYESADSVFHRNVELMTPNTGLDVDLEAARHRPRPERIAERLDAWGLGGLAGRLATAIGARPDRVPLPESPA